MKICMIGGTGLLGSQGAQELISRGHQVRAIALPPLPQGAVLPPEMEISYGNYLEMNDDEVKKMFEGCEGFVFAAGNAALSIAWFLALIFRILQRQDRKCT